MKNSVARFREAGSFIAGLLVGLSVVVPVFTVMVTEPGDWHTLWFVGSLIILSLGLTLQIVVTSKARHRRTTAQEVGALPIGFMELSHKRSTDASQRQCLARIA